VIPPAIDPGTVRLVAQLLNHYATPGPTIFLFLIGKRKQYFDLGWLGIADLHGSENFVLKTTGLAAISAVLKLRDHDALLGQTKES
jgi:hypothetical protein